MINIDQEMCKFYEGASVSKGMVAVEETFQDIAPAIRELAAATNAARKVIEENFRPYKEFCRTFQGSLSIGLSAKIKAAGYEPECMEDDDEFVRVITEIGNERNTLVKMKTLAKLNAAIATRIASWKSKEDKLAMRAPGDGATKEELIVIEKKLHAIKSTIVSLAKRGDTVTSLYYQAKARVEAEIKDIHNNFKPMYINGKESI